MKLPPILPDPVAQQGFADRPQQNGAAVQPQLPRTNQSDSNRAIAPPKPHAKAALTGSSKTIPPNIQKSSAPKARPHSLGKQHMPVTVAEETVISQDLAHLDADNHWEDDNTHLDDEALLMSLSRVQRDVEMIQAKLLGNRRSRQFTPGSASPNRSKFLCVDQSPPHMLDFSAVATGTSSNNPIIPDSAKASSSSSAPSAAAPPPTAMQSAVAASAVPPDAPPAAGVAEPPADASLRSTSASQLPMPTDEYDSWNAERYIQARQFSARERFWQTASLETKARMVRELYAQEAGTPATIQARENGWIPM